MSSPAFEAGDLCKVKLDEDISFQWFHALIVEHRGSIVVVDTCFPVGGQTRWVVKPDQIRSRRPIRDTKMQGSPSLQRELKKIIR